MRQLRGIPTARLEKMLVDAALLPELAEATSDAALVSALATLQARHPLNTVLLLQYAARGGTEPRWTGLVQAVRSMS